MKFYSKFKHFHPKKKMPLAKCQPFFLGLNNWLLSLLWCFYSRPVLASGYCRCLRLCICVSVRQSLACPRHSSGPFEARITKFGSKMQNTLIKIFIVLWRYRPWPSRSNLTWNSKFTPFWACLHHNSTTIQARITKFWPEVQNNSVKIPISLGGNWHWPSRSNFT